MRFFVCFKHVQDVTELRWLIASSPFWSEFRDTQPVRLLLNIRNKVMTLNLVLKKYGFHNWTVNFLHLTYCSRSDNSPSNHRGQLTQISKWAKQSSWFCHVHQLLLGKGSKSKQSSLQFRKKKNGLSSTYMPSKILKGK